MAKQDGPLDDRQPHAKDREASVAGSLSDMGVADLVQTLELGRKSGVLHLKARAGARAACHFRNGRVVDCELGELRGEEAFYRILRWDQGGFAIEFKPIEREERIQLPTQALLLQGMRRIDEWERAVEQLPPLDRRLEVDVDRLGERLAKVPDGANALLRLFDGRRTLAQVIEAAPGEDLASASTIIRLVADGILTEAGAPAPTPAAASHEGAPPGPAASLDVETAAAATPAPGGPAPGPERGGVDWFAGPVGPEAVVAPTSSWVVTAGEADPPRAPRGDWLEPPLPPAAAAAPPPAAARTSPPRPAVRFSIPVPPPGTLPPPPSVAETLARYRVPPRPAATAAPEPAPVREPVPEQVASVQEKLAAVPEQLASVTEQVPVPSAPVTVRPEPAPEWTAPAPAPLPSGARPAARPAGRSIRERLEPASTTLHLEAPPELARSQSAPRRSAVPYLAVGALVVAAIAAGTLLTRRPPLEAGEPAAAVATEEAGARADLAAPAPAPADVPGPAPAASGPAEEAGARAAQVAAPAAAVLPAAAPPNVDPAPKVEPPPKAEEADAPALLAMANQRYEAGRYAEAITAYRRAIALAPTAEARVALARALYDAHRDAEAMRELDRVIAANPRHASAWLLRGDIHQGENRADAAREAYERYLELEPDGEQARVVRTILGRDPQ